MRLPGEVEERRDLRQRKRQKEEDDNHSRGLNPQVMMMNNDLGMDEKGDNDRARGRILIRHVSGHGAPMRANDRSLALVRFDVSEGVVRSAVESMERVGMVEIGLGVRCAKKK